jgi:hypothetical protein
MKIQIAIGGLPPVGYEAIAMVAKVAPTGQVAGSQPRQPR